jgi:hypothetical protein
MTLNDRIAYIHLNASTLGTEDLVELKYALKELLSMATDALDETRNEIHKRRVHPGLLVPSPYDVARLVEAYTPPITKISTT